MIVEENRNRVVAAPKLAAASKNSFTFIMADAPDRAALSKSHLMFCSRLRGRKAITLTRRK